MAEDSYILLDDLDEDLRFTGEDSGGVQKVYGVIQTFNQKDIDDLLEALWKRPWKPEIDDTYYMVDLQKRDLYRCEEWEDDLFDNEWYNKGLVFKTKDEAMQASSAMLDFLKGGHLDE